MPAKSSSFQTILLVVFGSLLAAGVMVFALATAGDKSANVGQVTIWGTFDQGTVDAVLRTAAEQNPQLLAVRYTQRDSVNYEADLSEFLANGNGPDLFIMPQEQALHDSGKAIHIPPSSLSATQFANTFIDAASPFYVSDGTVALPILADPLVLYWNRDILASAGYANPPQFWDEVPALSQKVVQLDDAHVIQRASINMGEYRNINSAKDLLALLILQSGNSLMYYDKATGQLRLAFSAENSSSKSHVSDALSFYTKFADPSDPAYGWGRALPESRDAFSQAKLALYIGHASDRFIIAAANPNLNFSIAAVPQLRTGSSPVDVARVYGLALSRTSKNSNGALTAAYLIAAGNISTPLATALGLSPALRTAVSSPAEGVSDLINKETIISRSWIDPDPVRTATIFQVMVESVVSGGMDVKASIEQAVAAFGSIINI